MMNVQYDIMEITTKDQLILTMEMKYLSVCIHQHHNARNILSMNL